MVGRMPPRVRTDPDLDPIRSDARFVAFQDKVAVASARGIQQLREAVKN